MLETLTELDPQVTPFDIQKFIKENNFDPTEPYVAVDFDLWMNVKGQKYNVAQMGEMGFIVGKQKARKTYFTSALKAAGLSGEEKIGINLDLKGKNILSIDTEQPQKTRWRKCESRVMRMAGGSERGRYYSFNFRKMSVEDRVTYIDLLVGAIPNLGLILIDGVVDICTDWMNNKEAEGAVYNMMRWAEESGALTLGVLHLNKGDNNLRGHIGTSAVNKCDFIFEIEKDNDTTSTVKSRDNREGDFPPFKFIINNDDIPELDTTSSINW